MDKKIVPLPRNEDSERIDGALNNIAFILVLTTSHHEKTDRLSAN